LTFFDNSLIAEKIFGKALVNSCCCHQRCYPKYEKWRKTLL